MIKVKKILRLRMNGEGEDAAKVAANATKLLGSFGYTSEEISTLGAADDAAIGQLFAARRTALEADVITRESKSIASAAELNGKKFAYKNAEERIRGAAKDLGYDLTDDDLTPLEEKTRMEGIVRLIAERAKASGGNGGAVTPDDYKLLQTKLESTQQGQTAAQKAARDWEKKFQDAQASIPEIEDKIKANFFAENTWKIVALKRDVVETLTVQDEGVLQHMVAGALSSRGHKFAAEKQADGTFQLAVVDKEGKYVPMSNSVGNHTPTSYIAEIYAPLVKKSNGVQNNGNGLNFAKMSDDDMAKLSPIARKALQDAAAQTQRQ